MARMYFSASFGGVHILIASVETERGRDVVIQSPALGDQHTLTDKGRRLNTTRLEILFVNQPGQAPYLDRYDQFVSLVESGESALLSHPLDGVYKAKASDLNASHDADQLQVRVSCTFLRDEPPEQVFPAAAGANAYAGIEAVATAAAATDAAIASLVVDLANLEDSDVTTALATPAAALAKVTEWSEADELDSQEVFIGVATMTKRIDDAIETLALKTDLSKWDVYTQMILLRYTVVRAAQVFTADSREMFDLYVETPRPLIAICAEVYGAAFAVVMRDRVAKANRLRIPGLVTAGTTLKMPAIEDVG